jgi:hypothetical protein
MQTAYRCEDDSHHVSEPQYHAEVKNAWFYVDTFAKPISSRAGFIANAECGTLLLDTR